MVGRAVRVWPKIMLAKIKAHAYYYTFMMCTNGKRRRRKGRQNSLDVSSHPPFPHLSIFRSLHPNFSSLRSHCITTTATILSSKDSTQRRIIIIPCCAVRTEGDIKVWIISACVRENVRYYNNFDSSSTPTAEYVLPFPFSRELEWIRPLCSDQLKFTKWAARMSDKLPRAEANIENGRCCKWHWRKPGKSVISEWMPVGSSKSPLQRIFAIVSRHPRLF